MIETPLLGGRVTPGVVRSGDTVRRPLGENSTFVHAVLQHLEVIGFSESPRFLGIDDQGREVLSFIPGDVPPDLSPDYADETLAAAAQTIRRFHDATAGSSLAAQEEVVCHNDLSPCNFVFRNGEPIGVIDFDAARPGPRVRDLAYALFLWLNLGTDGPAVAEQVRRARVFLDAYGLRERDAVVDSIIAVQREGVVRVRDRFKPQASQWWAAQLEWVCAHRAELEQGL